MLGFMVDIDIKSERPITLVIEDNDLRSSIDLTAKEAEELSTKLGFTVQELACLRRKT